MTSKQRGCVNVGCFHTTALLMYLDWREGFTFRICSFAQNRPRKSSFAFVAKSKIITICWTTDSKLNQQIVALYDQPKHFHSTQLNFQFRQMPFYSCQFSSIQFRYKLEWALRSDGKPVGWAKQPLVGQCAHTCVVPWWMGVFVYP